MPMSSPANLVDQFNAVRDSHTICSILVSNSRTTYADVRAPFGSSAGDAVSLVRMYRQQNRPFVIRGLGIDWKVVKRWGSPSHLLEHAKIEHDSYPNRKYTVYKPESDGDLNQSHAAPFANMTLFKYLKTAPRQKLYLLGVPDKSGRGASPFEMRKGDSVPPLFADDIDSDTSLSHINAVFKDASITRRHVFINSDYSFTNLHYDTDWNMYLCVLGERVWTIAHPLQSAVLGASNGKASYSGLQPTKGFAGLSGHRLAHLVKFIQVKLSPGDVLFVPPTWWHVVEGMPNGFSCGVNFFHTFDEISINSTLDWGWEWLDRDMQVSESSNMMGIAGGTRFVKRACANADPELVSVGLNMCLEPTFVDEVMKDVRAMYEVNVDEFLKLTSMCANSFPDWRLCRQLLKVVVNSCIMEKAPVACFTSLCSEVSHILKNREAYTRALADRKRKR